MFHSWNVPPRYVASDDDTFITGLLFASIRILNNLMLVQNKKATESDYICYNNILPIFLIILAKFLMVEISNSASQHILLPAPKSCENVCSYFINRWSLRCFLEVISKHVLVTTVLCLFLLSTSIHRQYDAFLANSIIQHTLVKLLQRRSIYVCNFWSLTYLISIQKVILLCHF